MLQALPAARGATKAGGAGLGTELLCVAWKCVRLREFMVAAAVTNKHPEVCMAWGLAHRKYELSHFETVAQA